MHDNELLRRYVESASEEAFSALVERHINKVYSVALRHVGNPHQAEEVTQAVFVILARKSSSLLKHPVLSGWLYETARLTAVTFVRSEIRRTHREEEAQMQTTSNQGEESVWTQIMPLLDSAIAGLGVKEREALVLRFFDGKSMKDISTALQISEDAAKKRVSRAVESLRVFFVRRGVTISVAAITAAISTYSVQAAPAGLTTTVAVVAASKGAVAASTSTLTLVKGALKIMAWTKAKTAIAAGVGVLLVTTAVVEQQAIRSFFTGAETAPRSAQRPAREGYTQKQVTDIQPDGLIRFQTTVSAKNTSGETVTTQRFNNSDFVEIERILDDSGQPIQFTTRHEGNMYRYEATFNKPLLPGEMLALTSEGTMKGLIRRTKEAGVFEYRMNHSPGGQGDTIRIETHRLPAGAELISKSPSTLKETTRDGRIELQIEEVIPPGGHLAINYKYRMPQ